MAGSYRLVCFINSIFLVTALALPGCYNGIKEYKSECNDGHTFKRVSFANLMDSLSFYDKQYVEVSGKYQQGKDESVLLNDNPVSGKASNNALWVDFSQDCPLYLSGTRQGLFEYNDGGFTGINNKNVTLRGVIVLRNKGKKDKYKATIERVSLVKL